MKVVMIPKSELIGLTTSRGKNVEMTVLVRRASHRRVNQTLAVVRNIRTRAIERLLPEKVE